MKKISYVKQTDLKDCGVACLLAIMKYYGGYATKEYLREITKTTREGVSVYDLVEGSKILGFETKAIKGDILTIKEDTPLISHVIINNLGHFIVIMKVTSKHITIMDPSCGIKTLTKEEFQKITTNVYILLKPKNQILKQDKEKGLKILILPLVKKYKITILILFILSLIYTLTNIIMSYQFSFFLDLLNNKNNKTMQLLFIFLISIILLKEITNLFRSNLINYINHILDKSLLKDTYEQIIQLPYLYFQNHTKGDIVTRIQDIFTIRDIISKLLGVLLIDLVLIIILLVVILKINLKLGLITIFLTIIYLLINYFYNLIISKKLKTLKEQESIVNNHLIESLTSINTVKGMQIEDTLLNKLLVKYHDYQDTNFSLLRKYYQENFLKNLIYSLGLLIIIYLGFQEVLNNNFSLANLLVFNSLLVYYFDPIQDLSSLQISLKEASISFLRIKELFNVSKEKIEPDLKNINHHLIGNIKFSKLRYSYNNIKNILKCDNLEINAGNKVLLYGTSGVGKSTLMKLLVKYLTNYEGDILIDNRELSYYNLFDIRKKITYLSQDEYLYTDTIYNNIVLNNKIAYQEYLNILKLTGVDKIIKRSILKDSMLIENNGSNLSGGERQRILLARALVKQSDIYIFDESLSAIDIKNERYILKDLFNYLKNKTVIVISHRFNNRDLYQQFVLLDKGVIYDY